MNRIFYDIKYLFIQYNILIGIVVIDKKKKK